VVVDRQPTLRRVAVLGCSGAGKSTVAAALARRTGLPLVHLDEHFWQPGWVMPDEESWRAVQRRLVAAPTWVLDGNYSSTYDERLPLADTVVVVDASRRRCLLRVLRRTWRLRGTEVAPGCPHRVDLGHLRYIWRYPRRNQPRRDAAVAALGPEVRVVRLHNRREVERFLVSC
jgi:adenylate kinase family enzyme